MNIAIRTFLSLVFLMVALKASCQSDSCIVKQTFFPSGRVHEEGCERNGLREGLWKEYAEYDDQYYVRFIWTYANGLQDGPYKTLGETGITEAAGFYKSGTINDTLKYFSDEGQLTGYSVWDMGRGVSSKTFIGKPDFTIETIDGKQYIWIGGRKSEME